jgi:hypothetical protein
LSYCNRRQESSIICIYFTTYIIPNKTSHMLEWMYSFLLNATCKCL